MSEERDKPVAPDDEDNGPETGRKERDEVASEQEPTTAAASDRDEGVEPEDGDELDEGFEDDGLEPDPLASAHDAIDPDLLAIAEKPKPRWYRPLIMVSVCVLIVVMMVWFRLELLYFFTPTEPIDLGEAHDIELDTLVENRFVRLEGMPLAPRAINPDPRCGNLQGFPTYQRRIVCRGHHSAIPLMGRPDHDLLVQRYLVRQLRISYRLPEGEASADLEARAVGAVRAVGAIRRVRRSGPDELGRLVADVEGRPGRTDVDAVAKAIRFRLESSVPGIEAVRVERVDRDAPGVFEGRVVRIRNLGSRFAAVAEYLDECTDYAVGRDGFVVLDGSEAGSESWTTDGVCYGHAPHQYWPYLCLYALLTGILVLNLVLLFRFVRASRRS